jgi:hypothetical protein
MKPSLERRLKKLEQEFVNEVNFQQGIELVIDWDPEDEELCNEISPNVFEVLDKGDSPDFSNTADS